MNNDPYFLFMTGGPYIIMNKEPNLCFMTNDPIAIFINKGPYNFIMTRGAYD